MDSSSSSSSLSTSLPPLSLEQRHFRAHHWSRSEKRVWWICLLLSTSALYACRTTFPIVAPLMSDTFGWSKTDTGTALSAFFWGYSLTQILGGYMSDRFGAARVLLLSGMGWSSLTFSFPILVSFFTTKSSKLTLIVFLRVLLGACQGVHFPSMAALSSRHLNLRERGHFFSTTTAGTAIGTLLSGSVGSVVSVHMGWQSVSYVIGLMAIMVIYMLKRFAVDTNRKRRVVLGINASAALVADDDHNDLETNEEDFDTKDGDNEERKVPWLSYLSSKALWACLVCHFCQNNCFFILLSWLPTYFHESFPSAPSTIFNLVPWILMLPGLFVGNLVTKRLMAKGMDVGHVRKTAETICMATEALCLVAIGFTSDFGLSVLLMSVCLFACSFHQVAVLVNPQDLAPKHPGSIFGIVNSAGALPGMTESFGLVLMLMSVAAFASGFHKFGTVCVPMDMDPRNAGSISGISTTAGSFAGFVGVYIAGYILERTQSWPAVFNATAMINMVGLSVFIVFGSSKPIV